MDMAMAMAKALAPESKRRKGHLDTMVAPTRTNSLFSNSFLK